jgi:hypothetical protein
MSTDLTKAPQSVKTDLASNYGPIGLKAVNAAHLMLKRSSLSAKKPA